MTQFKLEDIASFIAPQGVDTLKISKLLMQYGFTESQSEALSAIFRQIFSELSEIKIEAVKFDLVNVGSRSKYLNVRHP